MSLLHRAEGLQTSQIVKVKKHSQLLLLWLKTSVLFNNANRLKSWHLLLHLLHVCVLTKDCIYQGHAASTSSQCTKMNPRYQVYRRCYIAPLTRSQTLHMIRNWSLGFELPPNSILRDQLTAKQRIVTV